MYIARIKYSHIAIPEELPFETKAEAEHFCKRKETNNPNVRWTEVDTKRKYK